MPQPNWTANQFFGNAAMPAGQGVMAWISICDFASWFPKEFSIEGSNRQLGLKQMPFTGKGFFVSDDFAGKHILLPARYYEGPGTALGAAKAQLSQAGEQWLSFDNKVTAALSKFNGFPQPPRQLRSFQPYWWDLVLDFLLGTEPFFQDVAATTPAGFPIAQAGAVAPGTVVTTAIAYAGSVRTFPIITLNVPIGNTQVISQFIVKNGMSGETLVITFSPRLAATTVYTITIDCEKGTVVDQNGQYYDHQGSFPRLYGPVGQSQNLVTTLIAAGATTGVTVSCSYTNRWEL